LDVPAILPQVQGDPVGPSQLGQGRRPDRVGFNRAASLPYRGDVVDIDAQLGHGVLSLEWKVRNQGVKNLR
jgi:hypothetical protein